MILQTPKWPHGDGLIPPQLVSAFMDNILALIFILIYKKNISTGKPVLKDTGVTVIETLQYVASKFPCAAISRIMSYEVCIFWVTHKCDPRHGGNHSFTGPEATLAVIATISLQEPIIIEIPSVNHFRRTYGMIADYASYKKAEHEFSIRSPSILLLTSTDYIDTPYVKRAIEVRKQKALIPLILSSPLRATLLCSS